jgi:hypothetical protein
MSAVTLDTAPGLAVAHRERLFFLVMSLVICTTVAGGFGIRIVLGITDFARPWWVHVHAVSFLAWLSFYVLQNVLVVRGNLSLHRALGVVGAMAALWVCVVGIALTARVLASGGVPPFFEPAYFLAQNWLFIVFFGALTAAAIALRHRPDWHRRLMLCATLVVGLPGLARWIILLAPPPDSTRHLLAMGLFLAPALVYDLVTRGRIHVAYLVGGGAILFLETVAIRLLAAFPPFIAMAERIAS